MGIPIEEPSSELLELQGEFEKTPEDLASDLMEMVVYQISRRLDERGWPQKRLAEEMGVKPPMISRLMRAENTSILTIAKAAFALDLKVGALKLIPEEEADEQVDELAAFVRSEKNGVKWWPLTRRRSSLQIKRLTEFLPKGAPSPFRNAIPESSAANDLSSFMSQSQSEESPYETDPAA